MSESGIVLNYSLVEDLEEVSPESKVNRAAEPSEHFHMVHSRTSELPE